MRSFVPAVLYASKKNDMCLLRYFIFIGLLSWAGLFLPDSIGLAQAQPQDSLGTTPTVKTADRDGRIILSEQQATDSGLSPTANLDRQRLPPEIKERIRRFEIIRDRYLREQAQLRKKLTGAATEEERERIRALIQDSRVAWINQSTKLREEAKERLRELPRLLPNMPEVLDEARRNAREIRKRRGQD
jgi:hypothetical protein